MVSVFHCVTCTPWVKQMQPWLTWRGFLFGNLTHRRNNPYEKMSDILQVADGHMVISATVSSSVRTWHSQEARIETILFQSQLACREMKNAEISLGFAGTKPSTLLCGRPEAASFRAGVSANFLYFNPCKKEVSCAWNYTMQTSESKEKNGLQKVRFLLQKASCKFGSHCGTTQGTGQSVGFWCPKMQRVRIGHWWWCFTGGWYQSWLKTDDVGARNFFWATHFGESSTTQIYIIWRLHTLWIFAFTNWDLNFE